MTAGSVPGGGLSREAKYAIGGAVGCLGLICLLCTSLLIVASVPDVVGLPLTVIAASIPAATYVLAVIWLDRYEREPIAVLIGTFFWGSVVAVVVAWLLELLAALFTSAVVGPDAANIAIAVVGAPVIEESAKGMVLLILFFLLRDEFDDTLDGIVYGSIVGLGFAMTENMLYFGQQYIQGGVSGLAQLFVLRSLLSGLGHALYTGTTGAGLGFARETTNTALKIIVPVGAFLLAIGQHFMWNGSAQLLSDLLPNANSFVDSVLVVGGMSIVLSGPALLVLLTIVVLSWRRERRVIREYLASEVQSGVVTPEDYAIISSSWGRAKRLWGGLFSRGLTYWYYLQKLYQTETDLAFRKWHESLGERPRGAPMLGPVEHLRSEIRELHAKLGTP